LRYKVFLDTSTLIAASIYLTIEAIGKEIKDHFYDEATRLMSIIKKNINKRIGITTFIVEEEAYTVLERAVERKLDQRVEREKVFELLSIAVNSCESRLRKVLSSVLREPINPVEAGQTYISVALMYNALEEQALKLPKPAAMMTDAAPSFLNKAEIFEMYRSQDEILNSQLTNLIYNPVEDSDKMILAQAACLCKLYKETEKEICYFLASTDHHFVPVRRQRLTSRQVTDKIVTNFGIIAERPQKIFLTLRKNGL